MSKRTYRYRGCTIVPTGHETPDMPTWSTKISGFRGEFGASTLKEMRQYIDEVLSGEEGPWTRMK
nr:MAG TPA_asm: hypothetical protein [Caudoviricetes sp.]